MSSFLSMDKLSAATSLCWHFTITYFTVYSPNGFSSIFTLMSSYKDLKFWALQISSTLLKSSLTLNKSAAGIPTIVSPASPSRLKIYESVKSLILTAKL